MCILTEHVVPPNKDFLCLGKNGKELPFTASKHIILLHSSCKNMLTSDACVSKRGIFCSACHNSSLWNQVKPILIIQNIFRVIIKKLYLASVAGGCLHMSLVCESVKG